MIAGIDKEWICFKKKTDKSCISYIHQESFLGSSHISLQLKITFDQGVNSPQRNPSKLQYTNACRAWIVLVNIYFSYWVGDWGNNKCQNLHKERVEHSTNKRDLFLTIFIALWKIQNKQLPSNSMLWKNWKGSYNILNSDTQPCRPGNNQ